RSGAYYTRNYEKKMKVFIKGGYSMKRLTNYFLQGLLFLVPLVITVYVFYFLFKKVDGLLKIPIPGLGIIPGVGFVTTILLIILIGFLVSNFLTKRIMLVLDNLFNRLPLVKLLYGSIKDLLNAFVGNKKSFSQPVLVKLTSNGDAHVLGFITCESLDNLGLDEMVSVYVPQSYNFAGQLLLFPRHQVTPLSINSAEVMTFIVSGGVAGN
ncbi:MAG TPA: DUF502 domain-containing protein, partial [Syntrophomonadaceae bacterium]|nr:DUF502 domain-containing protein [Syntrophomonadaceae bacterium]HQE22682.1 DUF502 domain-containing protein [Syntrophomonadaceae bacterium]